MMYEMTIQGKTFGSYYMAILWPFDGLNVVHCKLAQRSQLTLKLMSLLAAV